MIFLEEAIIEAANCIQDIFQRMFLDAIFS